MNLLESSLITKYNVPGPRYTSYPTVPYWSVKPDQESWKEHVLTTFKKSNSTQGISVYIHLPFCESLCTYCGCNTRITINHAVEKPYIEGVLKEWKLYLDLFGEKPVISELHLGGGTPTFFSPSNLDYLLSSLLKDVDVHKNPSFSFEAHPNNTTYEHMKVLFDHGFRRISLGIQDFDPVVQKTVNRIQSYEQVKKVTDEAREIGYESVNYDLIYGLPFQTMKSVTDTIDKVRTLSPDRIAFYSYAHVPWVKPGQRKFTEADLPDNDSKRALYENGRRMLEAYGYMEIGMDHFALPHDSLYLSMQNKTMHRNFMGYTTSRTDLMVSLGASSISDSTTAFVQNIKLVEDYLKAVAEGRFPFFKGHLLTEEDLRIRKHILNMICFQETTFSFSEKEQKQEILKRLVEMISDELVKVDGDRIYATEACRPFIRNVCMAFDERLNKDKPETIIFSSTI